MTTIVNANSDDIIMTSQFKSDGAMARVGHVGIYDKRSIIDKPIDL